MEILLIGGTGVLSKDITLYCLSQGDKVFLLNRGNNKNDIPKHDKCHLIIGNIRNTEGIKTLMKDQDFDVVVDFLSFNSTHLKNIQGEILDRATPEESRLSLTYTLVDHSFDRASAGYPTCTINLSSTTKSLLTSEEIAQITAKGFTIA